MTVDLVADLRAFTLLKDQWSDLLPASTSNGPFLTWEWLHSWWQHLHGASQLHVLVVRDRNVTTAIAPLVLSRDHLGFSRLELMGTGFAGSDYLDLIVRKGTEDASLAALADAVLAGGWALRLDHLRPLSLSARLAIQAGAAGWIVHASSAGICPYFSLAGESFDSYLATRGPSHRANVRRRLRALDRGFRVTMDQATTHVERQCLLDGLMTLHNQRWDARGGSTAFSSPSLRAFHHDFTQRALDRGWLRLYGLSLDDRLVAAMYGVAYNQRFYFYQTAFDERFNHHSVGMVMMARTIRRAIEEGAIEFDMLCGSEQYKSLWASGTRALGRIELFPRDMTGRLHERWIETERTLRSLARRVLPRRQPCRSHVAGALS